MVLEYGRLLKGSMTTAGGCGDRGSGTTSVRAPVPTNLGFSMDSFLSYLRQKVVPCALDEPGTTSVRAPSGNGAAYRQLPDAPDAILPAATPCSIKPYSTDAARISLSTVLAAGVAF